MLESVKALLEKSNNMIKERDAKMKEKLLPFNIFDICDMSYDEVKVCRFISELLNPKGRHLQGIKYLKLFFKEVLKRSNLPTDDELSNAVVMREESIENKKRIDISIFLNVNNIKQYIPIEVKVYARDRGDQCFDYYQHSLKMNGDDKEKSFVYYLTPYGQYPSLYSINKLKLTKNDNDEVIDCKEIKTISFKYEIYHWINAYISEANDNKLISERQVLLQFRKIVEDIGGNNMENGENKFYEYIASDEDVFKSAKLISDNLQKAANVKMKEFYDLIINKLDNWKKETSLDEDLEYYGIKNGKWPTMYKDIMIKGAKCELAITTEGDGIPFFGASLKQGEDNSKEKILIDFFNEKNIKLNNGYSYGWITWQYLPNDKEAPNFKNFNENYYLLFNEEKSKLLVEKCVNMIREFENKIKEYVEAYE